MATPAQVIGQRKLKYYKNLDMTAIHDQDGKFMASVDGDQTSNPIYKSPNIPIDAGQTNPLMDTQTIPQNMAQMGKDFVTNAASQAPLMIPGVGALPTIARVGGSLLAGHLTDKLLTPQRSDADRLGNDLFNTLSGMAIPGIIERIPGLKGFEMPGKRANYDLTTTTDPTTMDRSTTSTGTGKSRGSSSTDTNTSNQESSRSGGTSSTSSKGSTQSEGTSTSQGKGSTSGEMQSTSIRQPYTGEITPEMQNLRDSIERLKGRLDLAKNKSQVTQIQNAIDKSHEALAAHEDLQEGTITRTSGTRSGESSNTGSSTNKHEGTNTNVSDNKSQNQSESSGSSTSRGNTESQGSSSSTGSTTTEGTTTPGASRKTGTVTTTGESWHERLIQALGDLHNLPKEQMPAWKKFFIGMLPADLKSTVEDTKK